MSYISREIPQPWPSTPQRNGIVVWPALVAIGLAIAILIILGICRDSVYAGLVVDGSLP